MDASLQNINCIFHYYFIQTVLQLKVTHESTEVQLSSLRLRSRWHHH